MVHAYVQAPRLVDDGVLSHGQALGGALQPEATAYDASGSLPAAMAGAHGPDTQAAPQRCSAEDLLPPAMQNLG